MLDLIAQNLNPLVLALFPHRESRRGKMRVGERSERDGDLPVELALDRVMDGRAAFGAEMMGDPVAAVGEMGPDFRLAFDRHLPGGPARLGAERAPGPLLAVEAMAHRHPHRLAG